MKIALIGSTAFLAKTILQQFQLDAHQWLLCSRKRPPIVPPHVSWLPYNAPALPLPVEQLMGCDLIYFCAGAGIQPKHSDGDGLIYQLNAFEPILLVQELTTRGYTGKLVTFGSYFEIGDQTHAQPYTEQQLATHQNPLPNTYCRSKNLLTRFADNYLLQPKPLPFCWQHFILTNIYGVGENTQRLLPYIIQSIINHSPLKFTAGIQQRQYTHVRDVADFLKAHLENRQAGIFNLTAAPVYAVRSVIDTVLLLAKEYFGSLPPTTFGTVNKRDERMKYLAFDMQLTQKCFTFETRISLEAGIREYFPKML